MLVVVIFFWGTPAVAAAKSRSCTAVEAPVARNYPRSALEKLSRDSRSVVVGDSIAAYWPQGGLQSVLESDVVNLGYPQDQAGNVLWRLDQIAGRRHWRRALVIVGVNSAWKVHDCDVAAGIESVVDRLHKTAPGIKVIVLAILPYQSGLTSSLARIHPINARLSADAPCKDFVFVNPEAAFIRACAGKPSCPLLRDWLHPTDKGYVVIGNAITRALRRHP